MSLQLPVPSWFLPATERIPTSTTETDRYGVLLSYYNCGRGAEERYLLPEVITRLLLLARAECVWHYRCSGRPLLWLRPGSQGMARLFPPWYSLSIAHWLLVSSSWAGQVLCLHSIGIDLPGVMAAAAGGECTLLHSSNHMPDLSGVVWLACRLALGDWISHLLCGWGCKSLLHSLF